MIAQVNGIELFYEKAGEGRPLLMVHGNGEDHTIFDRAVGLLKKKYTCYAVDSRCHGRSSAFAELHYEDMARDMIAFMEALDLEDVIFYGFSDGGIVGLLAAAERYVPEPLRVSSTPVRFSSSRAFRTVLRDTPKRRISCSSLGNLPTWSNFPLNIS